MQKLCKKIDKYVNHKNKALWDLNPPIEYNILNITIVAKL